MKNTLSCTASGGTVTSSLSSVPANKVSIFVALAIEGLPDFGPATPATEEADEVTAVELGVALTVVGAGGTDVVDAGIGGVLRDGIEATLLIGGKLFKGAWGLFGGSTERAPYSTYWK